MTFRIARSSSWSPTIALSWFWGLGFFYAIHVTLSYGWLGFLAFALPNAAGLGLFGWILGAPRRDLDRIVAVVQGPYALLFSLGQLFAVAITIFGFVAYAWLPLFGPGAIVGVVALVLVACSIGHAIPLRGIRIVHGVSLALGVLACVVMFPGLVAAPHGTKVPFYTFDERFYGLIVPSLVGFLLGPWMDVQQWQRAVEIRRSGASVRFAYVAGAILFLGLLVVNALLAAAAGLGEPITSSDGIPGAFAAVAQAIARDHNTVTTSAFVVWTAIAAASTIDSFYCSTRWLGASVTARSNSPLLAFVPAGLVSSPVWILGAAVATTSIAIWSGLSLVYLMMPFATILVGGAACLVCRTLGATRRYDPVLSYMIGMTACLVFLVGYVAPSWALLSIAPLIGLIGALPMITELLGWGGAPPVVATMPKGGRASEVVTLTPVRDRDELGGTHGFDGQWFTLNLIPTYDDTNSVGNVYFANYVRWVGKTREMFFNACMPDFDLSGTDFFILTKSFHHDFRREAAEFEPIKVKIRIASHNRKFVTLAHEIHSAKSGLLGRGEQSLMFVDTEHYRPLDIPRSIVEGFLPYWPKSSPNTASGALGPSNTVGSEI
ncbi:acyl-CoA thioesterase [Methylobacterium sp. WL30]|nr:MULTISPECIES: thioesterase family protein [unclassified Methylobacterium]TXN40816.1 acyl-CoA thioesterase [Methylobacterium sp. WL93]TXN50728.1 acyl-CoA thioesterase [Methylobacterium sp. WL119]TXN67834.1 acyl-CoA thioesterase [Methylobacterium sp. WL30]